ncbi:SUF system Fe-S cluster assembly protein [Sphingorhabdus sp. Alg239-R122]|uniref:SUF system Fe-S cluster assembly protein n=1 Tax=Sphingorhabdus sp. Alg239-R122 TaxID=2305989 RepID=UPI0013DC7C8E|nr:SUF system Fe-S cluster assembly protein [Sphingorhabdus sp. Alg239-R122]
MNEERKISVEKVDAVDKPAKARVDDAPKETVLAPSPYDTESDMAKMERKRDYLEGFLSQKPAEEPTGEPGGDLYDAIIDTLKSIYDPEIPVNIYDLGLIYGVEVTDDGHAVVTMTLTTPHCPVAESMPGEIELQVGSVPGVGHSEVNLVWDPPWDPQKMSDEAKLELGML